MKVGFVQNNPVFGDTQKNLARVASLLGNTKADLLVLPELFATGYQFADKAEARALGEAIPDGPTSAWLVEIAKKLDTTLVAGIAELEADRLYNSAAIVGPKGYIGTYRKAHLFDTEKSIFEPGNTPLPVFDIGSAKVGIMICFDWRFPETCRTLALQGADLIAHPSNLVLADCPQSMITRCLENRVFAITADRVGKEQRIPGQSLEFIGQSQVVDPDGQVLYRADTENEAVHILEIDPQKARDKSINQQNDLFRDRREDLYRSK